MRGFVAAALAALTGCSLAEVQRPTTRTPQRCKWGHVAVDAAAAAGTLATGVYLLATAEPGYDDWLGWPKDPFQKGIGALLLGASAISAISAIHATDVARSCEQLNEELDHERVARDAMFARREQAWSITREAAELARSGNCNKVIELNAQVRQLDADFYATVFVRDVAIAHCLELLPRYSIK